MPKGQYVRKRKVKDVIVKDQTDNYIAPMISMEKWKLNYLKNEIDDAQGVIAHYHE